MSRLKLEGHRVLIFAQMTKMIDILEDYMRFRKHKFFRLDGATELGALFVQYGVLVAFACLHSVLLTTSSAVHVVSLADRRDMVNEFQTNPEYFAFILSTRAGGLGINLTSVCTDLR